MRSLVSTSFAGPATPSSHQAPRDTGDSPPPWGPSEQRNLLQRLGGIDSPRFDVLVVGAGITGAGIARDAALRGLSVLVVEAQDVAFGTSSRSTRLIHGGVRYLEQGEVGLVFEALRERSRLYALAPHLAQQARFLFPAYRGDRLGPWKLRLGLTLYDALDFHRGEGHTFLSPEACVAAEPLLSAAELRGAVAYEDAVTDDARLTLTVLQDARRLGAEVLTYTKVDAVHRTAEGTFVVDAQGGLQLRARQVVVATGPWTDGTLLGAAGEGLLTKSKGIHLVLRHADVAVRQPLVIQAPGQRRILFVVPWGSRTYVGTTDEAFEGDPGQSGVTEAAERELLDVVGHLLPGANLSPSRIVSAWSGVRPLVRGADGGGTEELSRRHRVVRRQDGVLAVVGGKLTTYRAMAEDAVDEIVAHLGGEKRRCTTHERPLVPGLPLTAAERRSPAVVDLAARHGPDARRIVAAVPDGGGRMIDELPYRWCEVDEAIEREGCRHLDDILRRRIPLALTDVALGGTVARRVAERLVDAWGGSNADVEHELSRYRALVQRETRRVPTGLR